MGQTFIEKLLSAHSDGAARAGEVIWVRIDLRTARDFGGASVVQHLEREYPGESVDDPARTCFTFDCNAPANTPAYASNQHRCRLFARGQGITVYDVNRGIGTHVDIDEGRAVPGDTVVGTDSHLNILGAIGAFGQGMGDRDVAFVFRTGRTWFEVPETMRVRLVGRPGPGASAKDLTLEVVRALGTKGALGRAIEYGGEAVEALSVDGRITLASMTTEMGGISCYIPPSEAVLDHCRRRSGGRKPRVFAPDPDAVYCQEVEIDVEDLGPRIAAPFSPANVTDVADAAGRPVDSGFIGSCTNGRLEDLAAAARILEGKHIHERVMLKVVPATAEIFGTAWADGILRTLFDAGAIISNPGCGGCASGQIGMTGEGEVQVSCSNRNFKGKQGAGETYLASPATVAASALAGEIAPP